MTTWDSNVPYYAEDSNEWYAEGSINLRFRYNHHFIFTFNDTSVEFLVYDSEGVEICTEMADLISGESLDAECELTRGDSITWSLESIRMENLILIIKEGFSLVIMVAIFMTGGVSLLYGLSIKTIIPSNESDALNDDEDVNMVVEAELVD